MSLRNWIIIAVLGTIWGSSFLFNAILIRELGPLWVSAGRVGVGALGSWVILLALRAPLPRDPKTYLNMLALGTLTYTIPFALFPLSQNYLASGVAAIVNAMTPIMTVLVSHFWNGGEKATWNKSLGVLAGFSGVMILASPALSSGGSSELWAIGACILATTCYAVSLNWTRKFQHMDPTVIATLALTGATFSATILAAFTHGVPRLSTAQGWGALMGIGLMATTLAFFLMYRILPVVGATNFTVTTFIAPISAILLGTIILNERLQAIHFLGMGAIFIGLLLIDGRLFRRKTPKTKKSRAT